MPRRPATAAAFGPSAAATNSTGSAVFTCAPVCRNRTSRTRSPSRYSMVRPAHRSCSAAVKFSTMAAVVGRMPSVRRAVFPVPTPQMIRPGARALRLANPLAAAGAERSAGEVTPMPSLMRLVAFAHSPRATKGSPWTIGVSFTQKLCRPNSSACTARSSTPGCAVTTTPARIKTSKAQRIDSNVFSLTSDGGSSTSKSMAQSAPSGCACCPTASKAESDNRP